MIALLLNVIWLVLGGVFMALGWLLAGILMIITIIGIPWARASFNIALYALWPFGREAIDRKDVTGQEDIGSSALGVVGNILWFVFAGWWLALGHLMAAIACAVTIIGIPLGWAHLKLAGVSLAPIGKAIVDRDEAARIKARKVLGSS